MVESVKVELISSYCEADRRVYLLKVKTRSPFWHNLYCPYNNAWKVFELIRENEFLLQSVEDASKEFSKKEKLSDSEKVYRIVFYDNCSNIKSLLKLVLKFIIGIITLASNSTFPLYTDSICQRLVGCTLYLKNQPL